jgi:hypothetical protein
MASRAGCNRVGSLPWNGLGTVMSLQNRIGGINDAVFNDFVDV